MLAYHDYFIAITGISTALLTACLALGLSALDKTMRAIRRDSFLSWLPLILALQASSLFGVALFVSLSGLLPPGVLGPHTVQVVSWFLVLAPAALAVWRLALASRFSKRNERRDFAAFIVVLTLISAVRTLDVLQATASTDLLRGLFYLLGLGVLIALITAYVAYRLARVP